MVTVETACYFLNYYQYLKFMKNYFVSTRVDSQHLWIPLLFDCHLK